MNQLPFDFIDLWFDWRFQVCGILFILFGAITAHLWPLLFMKPPPIPKRDASQFRILVVTIKRPEDLRSQRFFTVEFFNVSGDYRFLKRAQGGFTLDCQFIASFFTTQESAIEAANQFLNEKAKFMFDQPNS